jgi:cell division protein FtsB
LQNFSKGRVAMTPESNETNERPGLKLARAAYQSRRRLATVALIAIAVLMGYHVVNGHNGITVYEQKRAEDKALRMEIDQLQQENLRLTNHVERLKTDPNAIIHEARERLHYALPDEVIVTQNGDTSEAGNNDSASSKPSQAGTDHK